MGSIDIHTSIHLKDGADINGDAGALSGYPYPVLYFRSLGYPGATLYPKNMAQVTLIANACLDVIVAMVEQGAVIDNGTHEALARLAQRAHALSFDEDAEAQAAEAVRA